MFNVASFLLCMAVLLAPTLPSSLLQIHSEAVVSTSLTAQQNLAAIQETPLPTVQTIDRKFT